MINMSIEFAHKMSLAYSATCKTLCRELKLPQTAFDILMFLANNPDYKTASDIVEVRKIKANLVSVNVEKLVRDGYLERKAVESDRRKVELICTKKAEPVIENGKKLQQDFVEPFDLKPAKKISLNVALKNDTVYTQNVVGILEGTDPVLKSEYVAIGAHYDHVGMNPFAPGPDKIWNGADDDGSGTVSVLNIAEAFAKGLHDLLGFVQAQQSGIDKHAGELVTNRAVDECCRDRGIHTP